MKSPTLASFLTDLKVIQEAEIKCQKTAEWDEWPRIRPTYHWKASPMMKNQTAKIKKVKS